MEKDIALIEKQIGYKFKDKSLLETAFTHSSYAFLHGIKSNERLEFLGDSILNFITANYLYSNYELKEGELSKIRAYLVSADNLSFVVENMNIISYLKHGNFKAEQSKNVMCDLFEAIVGAIYLDSNIETAKNYIFKVLNYSNQTVLNVINNIVDYKTKLQEFVQKSGKNTISYVLAEKSGKAHEPSFRVELYIEDKLVSTSTANSKKVAENMCAKMALEILEK